jgi:hypothetical protein
MINSQEEEIVITEELTESTIDSKEAEQLKILIPIFCDLYKDSYSASFIADMIKRQYLFDTSSEDIKEQIIEHYKQ